MPTAGIVNSRIMIIKVGSTVVSCLTDASLSISQEFRDTTCKDSGGFNNILPAKRTWELSGSALFSYDGTYTFDDIFALWNTQASATVIFGTTVSGDKIYTGTAYLSSLSASSSGTDENVTYEFSLTGSGTLTESTNP
jgi:hypothetical protein